MIRQIHLATEFIADKIEAKEICIVLNVFWSLLVRGHSWSRVTLGQGSLLVKGHFWSRVTLGHSGSVQYRLGCNTG